MKNKRCFISSILFLILILLMGSTCVSADKIKTAYYGRNILKQVKQGSKEEEYLRKHGCDHPIEGIYYYRGNDGVYWKDAPIEWYIIKDTGSDYILLAKYVDMIMYYDRNITSEIFWDSSYMRSYLNNDYINTMFSKSERNQIKPTTLSTEEYSFKDKPSDTNKPVSKVITTNDKVFLLSADEIKSGNYTITKDMMIGKTTDFVKHYRGDTVMPWWLRGPRSWFYGTQQTPIVNKSGEVVTYYGSYSYGVRPCIRVPKTAKGLRLSNPGELTPSFLEEGSILLPPTDINLTRKGYDTFLLSWRNVSNAYNYKIYVKGPLSKEDTTYKLYTSTDSNSAVISMKKPGKYSLQICSVDKNGKQENAVQRNNSQL